MRICSAHVTPDSYRKMWNGKRKATNVGLLTIFHAREESTPRNVHYESVRKKRRLNDDFKTCGSSQNVYTDGEIMSMMLIFEMSRMIILIVCLRNKLK